MFVGTRKFFSYCGKEDVTLDLLLSIFPYLVHVSILKCFSGLGNTGAMQPACCFTHVDLETFWHSPEYTGCLVSGLGAQRR